MLVVAAVHAGHEDIAPDQRIVERGATEASAGRTDPAQLLLLGEEFGPYGPAAASAVLMSVKASLGAAQALATARGTARLIFSGHDGSASGGSNGIAKLIGQFQLVHLPARQGIL